MPFESPKKPKRKLTKILLTVCGVIMLLFLGLLIIACFIPLQLAIGNRIYLLQVNAVEAASPWAKEGVFIHSSWDGPTGTFSRGDIYGIKLLGHLLRFELVEDPLTLAQKRLPQTLKGLIECLNSKDSWTRLSALRTVAAMGAEAQPALPALLRCMEEGDDQASEVFENIARASGAHAVPALTSALNNSPKARVRAKAAELIGDVGPGASAAVPLLKLHIFDAVPQVSIQCAIALRRLGDSSADVVIPLLIEYLDHRETEVQQMAAIALGEFGEKSTNAVPLLTQKLGDSSPQIRALSARALGMIGPSAGPAISNLLGRLDDPEPEVVLWSIKSLGLFGPEAKAAIPSLTQFAQRQGRETQWAFEALGGMGFDAVPPLLRIYQEASGVQRIWAAQALMQIGPGATNALPLLMQDLRGEDTGRLQLSAQIVGCIGNPAKRALPELDALLRHPDGSIRVRAAQAIWKIAGHTEIVWPILVSVLENRSNLNARRCAIEAFGDMGSSASNAVPLLRQVVLERQPVLSSAAADALDRILKERLLLP